MLTPDTQHFRPVALIPVYNHHAVLEGIVDTLLARRLSVILVDDGSSRPCADVLDALGQKQGVTLVRNPVNGGKGAACMLGFMAARFAGYTHVLQVDADGQHDLAAVPDMLKIGQENPEAFVCGTPRYDASVPKARLWGRKLTNFWVHVNTNSRVLEDAMCGFRLYPLAACTALMQECRLTRRMDFDPEIAVRLIWQGVPVINHSVAVTYPQDGISHFQALRDNVRISCLHARLFILMLARKAGLVGRRTAAKEP